MDYVVVIVYSNKTSLAVTRSNAKKNHVLPTTRVRSPCAQFTSSLTKPLDSTGRGFKALIGFAI